MLVFGYSFGENPTTLVKEELNVLWSGIQWG